MSSWHEFWSMGGYAAYVWPAYGLVFVVMVLNAYWPGRQRRKLLEELRRRFRNEDPRA